MATEQQKLMQLAAKYSTVPNDLNMFPGPGFTFTAPTPAPGCPDSMAATLQAGLAAGRVPASLNPSGQLYSRGTTGLTLEAPGSSLCEPGCFGINPDPRNSRVKPLYTGHTYKLEYVPTANNVTGMY